MVYKYLTVGGSQDCLASVSITPDYSSSLQSRQVSSELIASSLGVYSDNTLYTEGYQSTPGLLDQSGTFDCTEYCTVNFAFLQSS